MTSTWRKLAWGLLWVGLACSAFVAAKYQASWRLAPTTAGLRGCALQERIDVLFIGSSLTRQGYDIAGLEQVAGGSMYALAYDGLTPGLMDELLAHLAGERPHRIGKVVIEAAPSLATEDRAGLEDIRLFLDAPPELKARLLPRVLKPVRDLETAAAAYELLVNASNDSILSYPITGRLVESTSYRGGYTGKVMPSMTREEFLRISEAPVDREPSRPDKLQEAAYRSISATLRRAGIPYLFLEIPIPRARQEVARYREARETLRGLLASMGDRMVEIPPQEFDTSDHVNFADPGHLSSEGRRRYSELIAGKLRSGEL